MLTVLYKENIIKEHDKLKDIQDSIKGLKVWVDFLYKKFGQSTNNLKLKHNIERE